MFGELIEPTLDTIKQMRISGLTVVALSNTNATHVKYWKELYPELVDCFDHMYLSNEIGMRKPEPRAFEHVLVKHNTEPSQAIFFDDKLEYINAGKRVGIESILFDDDSVAALWWKRRPVANAAN